MKINIITLFILLLSFGLYAQGPITGKVIDAQTKESLIGASIENKALKINTLTNANGNFNIFIKTPQMLSISYLGYVTKDTLITTLLNEVVISLQPDTRILNEVVVNTGYQKLNKERSTGAFEQLNAKQLDRVVSPNLISRLDGNVSGLVFNRTNQENDISIRGRSTLFAAAQPLIVIDDFPYEGDLSNINPNDVESITVLKDAAAASVWGTRAGNGVIVITTKKGKVNQPLKVTFNANTTLRQKPDLFYEPRMSTAEFIGIEQQLFSRGFYTPLETSINKAPLSPVVELLIAKRDGTQTAAQVDAQIAALSQLDIRNDMEKHLYQNDLQQQYYLQLSGGSLAQRYQFSLGYDTQKADLVGNQQKRISLNAGNSFSLFKQKLEINQNASLIFGNRVNNNLGIQNLSLNSGTGFIYPYAQLMNENGNAATFTRQFRNSFTQGAASKGLLDWTYQPLNEINLVDNQTNTYDYRVGLNLKYRISKAFNAQVFYQYNLSQQNRINLQSSDSWFTRNLINSYSSVQSNGSIIRPVPNGGVLDESNLLLGSHNFRGQLNFEQVWQNNHELQAIAGYELRDNQTTNSSNRQYGYQVDNATFGIVDYLTNFPLNYNPAQSIRIPYANSRSELTDRFLSYYSNAAYTYQSKYTFTASARLDRSNLFGVNTNQKGVPLGSVGLRWQLDKESFYKLKQIPQLALRASFGYNGNIDKSVSAFTTARTIANSLLTALPYARIINPPNASLQWERTKIINIGLDFSTKDRRLSGNLAYYFKNGLDLIGDSPLPPSVGISNFRGNTSNTKGQGFDITINSQNIKKAFTWETDWLISFAKDEVTSYSAQASVNNYLAFGSGTGNQNLIYPLVGKPLFAVYSYKWGGLNPQTGAARGFDANGNLTEDYTALLNGANPDNLIYHGSARPLYFGGVRNTFGYKNWNLTANIVYRLSYFIRKPTVAYNKLLSGEITHADFSQRWQRPGDEVLTQIPALPITVNNGRDQFYQFSEELVERGDHIRLQDINLSYQLKPNVNKSTFFRTATLYFYVANPGILWKAGDSVYDPDYFFLKPVLQTSLGLKVDF